MSSSPEVRIVLRGADTATVRPAQLGDALTPGAVRPLSAQATARAEAAYASAQAAGFAAGWAEGQRAAAAAAREERELFAAEVSALEASRTEAVHRALAALSRAADELERRALPDVEETERAIAAAAFVVAEAVVGRELELSSDPGVDAVRRALALAPQGRPVKVRLNPADASAVQELQTAATVDPTRAFDRDVAIVEDPSLASGDAVAECDATRIDARIGASLGRVREVLAQAGDR